MNSFGPGQKNFRDGDFILRTVRLHLNEKTLSTSIM